MNWVDFIIPLVGLVILVAGLSPLVRAKNTQATMELLRAELEVEREARQEQERRYTSEVAELRGQVKFLTQDFAKIIAAEVAKVLLETR